MLETPSVQGDSPSTAIKTIVMVHGAWADGSAWSKVVEPLEDMGLQVVAVHLPLTSLADDTAAVSRALKLVAEPVLLVGHSYGGVVITVAGTANNVAGLVYVAAFAPDIGQSAAALSQNFVTPMATETLVDDAGFIRITRKGIEENFAQDLSMRERAVVHATQSATSIQCLASPATAAAWRDKPSWYVLATHDRTIAPELQTHMANGIKAKVVEIGSSHVPMLSHPEVVVSTIGDAVRELAMK